MTHARKKRRKKEKKERKREKREKKSKGQVLELLWPPLFYKGMPLFEENEKKISNTIRLFTSKLRETIKYIAFDKQYKSFNLIPFKQ